MNKLITLRSLGCDKNTVDSENMLGILLKEGFIYTEDWFESDVIIINTCCFIQDALEESIQQVLEAAAVKKENPECVLIVTGCMAQRYKTEILKEIPEVDGIMGTKDITMILETIQATFKGKPIHKIEEFTQASLSTNKERVLTNYPHTAYLKIGEGCSNHCTYCIIPKIRGEYISRAMESILEEANDLAEKGVTEIILVAQDCSYYGKDITQTFQLPLLLRKLCDISGIQWIRILYCYPENITDELIQVIKTEPKICKYIDMPIQHGNDVILKRMGRRVNQDQIRNIVNQLRKEIPAISIRTTLITGFPGEGDQEFQDVYHFIEELKFDRLGVFTYSREEGTPAYHLENQVPDPIKEERKDKIMRLQQNISYEYNKKMKGKILDVIIDGKIPDENVYIGRSYKDAPDIDGLVFIDYDYELISGDIIKVKIKGAKEYDLIGDVFFENESGK